MDEKKPSILPLVVLLLIGHFAGLYQLPYLPTSIGIVATVSGSREIIIVHEASEDTPEFARQIVSLRTGSSAEYLKSNGHTLLVIDQDAIGTDGQPLAKINAWRPFTLPEMFISDSVGKKLLWRGKLPADVIAEIKKHGG